MKKMLFIYFIVNVSMMLLATKIDLNTATLKELTTLPISSEQAEDIIDHRDYISFFKSI